ncbi:hypothetical protein I3U40_18195 [Mycobacteroides abscessus subsp. abscessus]|uniref:hypothetical protein n=1 Tax=Mycobacteroides abscessus TaxID=36809 RepID=UPI0009A73926|nr:hypothetical protein [Mycobacteroides abscessus]QSM92988.1 hypothetical protein I3U31_18185 [Mycobacteroides abscessus subsp. abscessus]QSM98026.1 hypothetical protein I3U40_18195 [Mycobacteroides abscessus subsp. abscessus]SLI40960.1 Uncharacterised protein [Mycobacteroides abscessus subsp. abscessus]
MSPVVKAPEEGFYVLQSEAGNPAARRCWLTEDGRRSLPVTVQVADWLVRAWEHDCEAERIYSEQARLDAWSDDYDARKAAADAEVDRALRNGKYGDWNPLALFSMPFDIKRAYDAAKKNAAAMLPEAEAYDEARARLNADIDNLNANADAINHERRLLGNPPLPTTYPAFAYEIVRAVQPAIPSQPQPAYAPGPSTEMPDYAAYAAAAEPQSAPEYTDPAPSQPAPPNSAADDDDFDDLFSD